MGAHPYHYVVAYDADVPRALAALRRRVFESGELNGAARPRTPEEALESWGADGTRSILDIQRVAASPDYFCTAPFSREELMRYFGTEQPSDEDVLDRDDMWEDLERGQARHAVVYRDGAPTGLVFVGYSFD